MAITGNDPLCKELMKIFGLPERTVWFEIRFALDEVVSVRCCYYPDPDKSVTVTGQFKLVEVEDASC